jgi:uncharacterized RDD family membrane protein YckC
VTRPIRHAQAMALQGHRAGFISRLIADALDLGVVWAIGLSVLLFAGVVRYLVAARPLQLPVLPSWQLPAGGAVIAVAYLTFGWASTGRTGGKQVAGLRVADRSGRRLSPGRALLRAVLYVLFPAGLLWVLVSRHNASVQDLIVGSVVIYDWHYHPPDESPPSGDARSASSAPGSEQR